MPCQETGPESCLRSELPKTPFEAAVDFAEYSKSWVDWGNEAEICGKHIAGALGISLACGWGDLLPDITKFLERELSTLHNGPHGYKGLLTRFCEVKYFSVRKSTEFILRPTDDTAQIHEGFGNYQRGKFAIGVVEFLLNCKPCCRLAQPTGRSSLSMSLAASCAQLGLPGIIFYGPRSRCGPVAKFFDGRRHSRHQA
jgi:hypothetical protein